MKIFSPFALLFLFPAFAVGQTPEEDLSEKYEWRIQQEYLDGIYIPGDVEDALEEIQTKADPDALKKFQSVPEDSIKGRLQLGLGLWMKSNWQFHDGSRLSHQLKEKGLSHPDDMAEFLIVCLHRTLNDHPLDQSQLAQAIVDARKKRYLQQQKNRKKEVIYRDSTPH